MSNAFASVGTKIYLSYAFDSSTEVYVAVAEVKSISGPSPSREQIDVTNLDSTGGWREFIPSFRDGGEVTLSMNFSRTDFENMSDNFNSNVQSEYLVGCKIVLSDTNATEIVFDAFIMSYSINIDTGDAVTSDVTLKVSGAVDFTT
ncbi:MAG: hypothetical protein GF411_03160 [Candidatus Lokiarchaeota archaeon]|nr:hypothetical protein [Candidatus Lokiarchaeota archaeon]